jgi:hypothetical protein
MFLACPLTDKLVSPCSSERKNGFMGWLSGYHLKYANEIFLLRSQYHLISLSYTIICSYIIVVASN